jgi:hypothetical protein
MTTIDDESLKGSYRPRPLLPFSYGRAAAYLRHSPVWHDYPDYVSVT